MFATVKRVPTLIALVLAAVLGFQVVSPVFAGSAHAATTQGAVRPVAAVVVVKNSVFKTTGALHLRAKANKTSKSLAVIAKGKKVKATSKTSGKWFQVKLGAKKGWTSSKYLKLVSVPPKVAAGQTAEQPKRLLPTKPLPVTYAAKLGAKALYKNGKLPADALCAPKFAPTKDFLCGDAVKQLQKLNKAFEVKFGHNIPINISYRNYKTQVKLKEELGKWAAEPGTSNHGWGLAIDLLDQRDAKGNKQFVYGAKKYEWLKKHGPKTGWINPAWAQEDGSLPEPWHFEFVG